MCHYINLKLYMSLYEEGYRHLRLVKYTDNIIPSYGEVIDFLLKDKTDFLRYVDGSFICNDFNALVHNRAQYYGLECSLCFLDDLDNECGHTCICWDTLDYGRIYTDSTGVYEPDYSYLSYDKIIGNVGIGKPPVCIDIESGFSEKFDFIIGNIELF